jgi:hypothetical protein
MMSKLKILAYWNRHKSTEHVLHQHPDFSNPHVPFNRRPRIWATASIGSAFEGENSAAARDEATTESRIELSLTAQRQFRKAKRQTHARCCWSHPVHSDAAMPVTTSKHSKAAVVRWAGMAAMPVSLPHSRRAVFRRARSSCL